MIRWLLILIFFIACHASVGQKFPSDYWHVGKVVLESGDTLNGQVKYSMQDDVVQLQINKRLETYTARKILFFEIFDVTTKQYRDFYSLPYAISGQYKAPIFFELLEEGKMTLLAREAVEVRSYSSYYYYGATTRLVLVSKYYLLKEDGNIQPFSGKKSELISMMGPKGNSVEDFIKENHLDFDRKYDVAKAVKYYNSL
jgi:hypothetical protein